MDSWQNNGMTTKSYSSGSSISTNSGSGTWAETLVLTTNPSTGIKKERFPMPDKPLSVEINCKKFHQDAQKDSIEHSKKQVIYDF